MISCGGSSVANDKPMIWVDEAESIDEVALDRLRELMRVSHIAVHPLKLFLGKTAIRHFGVALDQMYPGVELYEIGGVGDEPVFVRMLGEGDPAT